MLDGFWIFLSLGGVAGVMAGLLGVGGGLVLVAALVWLLPAYGIAENSVMHAALATSMASIVLTAASSAYFHHRRGSVLWPTVAWMVPGLLVGGWIGSLAAISIDGALLRVCVAAYCFIAGAQMMFRSRFDPQIEHVPRGALMSAVGVGIGAVSSIVGIGGGSMTVPLLTWRGVAPVRAVGTSSACGVAIAWGSVAGYAFNAPIGALPTHAIGYVYLPAAIGVAIASVIAAPWGAKLAHAISGPALKRVFAIFLLGIGTSLFFQ